jgi:hypothetical protein
MAKFLLSLMALCCFYSAHAQLNWKSKGPLYEDQFIAVEIEYAMADNACGPEATPSQYRYKITKLKSNGRYYIHWRFDYFNCEHQLKTHVNSLLVDKTTRTGYITPEDNQFSALKLANNFNAVHKYNTLPGVTAYDPVSPVSMEPKAIVGKLILSQGESTTLSLQGGYLAANTTWTWHEGNCNGPVIATGSTIMVRPRQTTVYAVQGEGSRPTSCVLATVTVPNVNQPATVIIGKQQICDGEKNVQLTLTGGQLVGSSKWVWYQDNCGGIPLGSGPVISVSPVKTTAYYVRAEGSGGNTECRVHEIIVAGKSKAPDWIDGPDRANSGESFNLSVHGGTLAPGAQWVWYSGSIGNKAKLGIGSTYTVSSIYADQTYYVRAEGSCYQSEFVSKTVRASKRSGAMASPEVNIPTTVRPAMLFINGGVVFQDVNKISNANTYVLTIGRGRNLGWFLRAKISGEQSKAAYQSTGTQITNYDLPGFYQYNSKSVSKRAGYTGGLYFGSTYLAVYIGGGYGTREAFYGIDQYNYGSSYAYQSAWIKNSTYSCSGAELEGGLMLKAGYFNIMGGVSTIQGKYTDYNFGIGINF